MNSYKEFQAIYTFSRGFRMSRKTVRYIEDMEYFNKNLNCTFLFVHFYKFCKNISLISISLSNR